MLLGEDRWSPHLPLLPQVMPSAQWGRVLIINPACEGATAFRHCGAALGDNTHQIKGIHGIISKTFSSTGLSEDTDALDHIRPASNTSCIRPCKFTDVLLIHCSFPVGCIILGQYSDCQGSYPSVLLWEGRIWIQPFLRHPNNDC